MATSPQQQAQKMIANLEEKTGRSLEQWSKLLDETRPEKHGEIVKLLKGEHGVTHGFANLIAHEYRARNAQPASGSPVDAQYAGAKAGLRPIYDALLAAVGRFGDDVEVAPKKAYVSLRRNKQFALIQPSTRDRVDVGINLGDVEPSGRLEASGSFNAMVSHRVRLTDVSGVDAELKRWLKQAYEAAQAGRGGPR